MLALLLGNAFLVGKGNCLDDGIDIVVESSFGDDNDDIIIVLGVLINVLDQVNSLALAYIVLRSLLIGTKNLHGGRPLDLILLGEVTVGHDINSTEFNFFVSEGWIASSQFVLSVEGFAVGAPVSIESDDPGVFIIVHDLLLEVTACQRGDVITSEERVYLGRDERERGEKLHIESVRIRV